MNHPQPTAERSVADTPNLPPSSSEQAPACDNGERYTLLERADGVGLVQLERLFPRTHEFFAAVQAQSEPEREPKL